MEINKDKLKLFEKAEDLAYAFLFDIQIKPVDECDWRIVGNESSSLAYLMKAFQEYTKAFYEYNMLQDTKETGHEAPI